MRVVDQAEERALLGSFGEQRQNCERHAVEIRRIAVAQSERAREAPPPAAPEAAPGARTYGRRS